MKAIIDSSVLISAFLTRDRAPGQLVKAGLDRRSRWRLPSALAGDEFIFDVQTHMVDPTGGWRENAGRYWEDVLASFPHGSCGERDPVDCFAAERFIKHVFLDSDTELAVLSFVPELPERNPLSLEEAERVRVLVERMEGAHRLFLHAMVVPNAPAIDPWSSWRRPRAVTRSRPGRATRNGGPRAWAGNSTARTSAFPSSRRRASSASATSASTRACCSRGFPEEYGRCADVGRAARLYPDVNFIIYHSGFETGHREGPFDPASAGRGVDTLIKSLRRQRHRPERQRLCRARQHVALRDARPDDGRPPEGVALVVR